MTTPVQMLYLIKRKEAWYQLPDDERAVISATTVDATRQAGGQRMLLCDATWSSGECEFFELAEFPDLAAVRQRIEYYERANLFRYFEIKTILGVRMGDQLANAQNA